MYTAVMDLLARAELVVKRLIEGDFAAVASDFDATMSAALPEPKLGEVWASTSAAFGALSEVVEVKQAQKDDHEIAFVHCRFERLSAVIRIVYHRATEKIAGFFIELPPPAPRAGEPPYSDLSAFTEVDVRIGPEPDALGGTLSVPNGEGPFPAVVLVHGSGPHDRDETILANRPFRDLAHGLASRGIVVLRYDKRTKVHPASLAAIGPRLTVQEETVSDAVFAAEQLMAAPKVDPRRVLVLGHSLGGFVAPRIGRAAPSVYGLILLAANARPLEDLVLEQCAYLLPLQAPKEVADAELAKIRTQVALVKSPDLGPETPASELPFGIPAPYWIDLNSYSPTETARLLDKPMLILQGGRDYQVTVEDLELWKAALAEKPHARCLLFPDENHLFMAGHGKSRPEEYAVAGHVSAGVIDAIATFVLEGAAPRRS